MKVNFKMSENTGSTSPLSDTSEVEMLVYQSFSCSKDVLKIKNKYTVIRIKYVVMTMLFIVAHFYFLQCLFSVQRD